jgi:elongation factor Ts
VEISISSIKELREQCGAGIMECRNALASTEGDIAKALEELKEKGCIKAAKKAERITKQGLVEAYIHIGGRIGSMIELNCETDFVARTDEFKELAHNLAMQVAAMHPQFISEEGIPPEQKGDFEVETACLLRQAYIKDQTMTIQDLLVQAIARVGENIKVSRFTRYELGVR